MSSLTLWKFQTVSWVRRGGKKHVFEPFDSFDFLSLSSRKAAEKQLSDQKTLKTRVHRQNRQRLNTNFFFLNLRLTKDTKTLKNKSNSVDPSGRWKQSQDKVHQQQDLTDILICTSRLFKIIGAVILQHSRSSRGLTGLVLGGWSVKTGGAWQTLISGFNPYFQTHQDV